MTLHIMAAMAEHEAQAVSQRTKAALQAAKDRGRKRGWSIPSRRGEQAQASAKGVTSNVTTANRFAANVVPVIRDIERAGVTTLQGIAAALNARGIKTARGRQWYATTVKNVLDRANVEGVKEAA